MLTTLPALAKLAEQIGGATVRAESLLAPGMDSHTTDPGRAASRKLKNANLLISIGAGLERSWLPARVQGSGRAALLPQGAHSLQLGQSTGEPHLLQNPALLGPAIDAIAAKLAALRPEQAAPFTERAQALQRELEARLKEWRELLAPYAGALVASDHPRWTGLLRWAGLVDAGSLEAEGAVPPGPDRIVEFSKQLRERKVRLILVQAGRRSAVSTALIESAMLRAIPVDAEGPDALAAVDQAVRQLAEALKKTQYSKDK